MKKTIVALILASGVTAIAFAALDTSASSNKKMKTEKKAETKKNASILACIASNHRQKASVSQELFYYDKVSC
jgi:hypothetical protein